MAYVKIEPKNSYDTVFTKELQQINSSLPETVESAFYIPQDS